MCRAESKRTHSEREFSPQTCRGDEEPAFTDYARVDPLVQGIEVAFTDASRARAEAEDSELCGTEGLEISGFSNDRLEQTCPNHSFLYGGGDGIGAEVSDRRPDLESARVARQLLSPVGEVALLLGGLDVLEVLRPDSKRCREN